ncbi:hypothetical protein S245_005616, partial [Arachis hypogaea]
ASCLHLPGFLTSTLSTNVSLIPNSETQTLSSLSLPLESLSVSLESLLVHTHRRLVAPLLSSPAFQRLAAFPGLLLTGDRSTRRIIVACRLLVSITRRRESPWIVDRRRVVTCFVARPLLGPGPLRHPVALVNGVTEVEGIAEEKTTGAEEDEEKGVPGFWLNAMKNNEVLAEEANAADGLELSVVGDAADHEAIDKKLHLKNLKVSQAMSGSYLKVSSSATLKDAIQCIHDGHQNCVLVVDQEGFLEGIRTYGDIRRCLPEKSSDTSMRDSGFVD